MSELFEIILNPTFWFSVIRVTTPIIFPALGAVITNKAGTPNIGLEGIMLFASLSGVLISASTANVWLGLLAAVLTGVALSLFLGYFTLKLQTDVILGGIALNLFASGGTIFLLYLVTGDKGTSASLPSKVLPNIDIPLIENVPFIGEIVSGHNILTYVAFISLIAMSFLFRKTVLGRKIKAVGEYDQAAESVGISVVRTRYIAFIISGIFCGLGGAFLSMSYVSWFSRDMTAGRGWIALAAEAMGRGTVGGTALSSVLFGFASALGNTLQKFSIPSELIGTIPYVATVVGIVVFSMTEARKKSKAKS